MVYTTFEEHLFLPDVGDYISYGIKAVDESGCTIIAVHDISPNKDFVVSLCETCNKQSLSPEHLAEVVYDSIA